MYGFGLPQLQLGGAQRDPLEQYQLGSGQRMSDMLRQPETRETQMPAEAAIQREKDRTLMRKLAIGGGLASMLPFLFGGMFRR